jgi:hypothetical protein
MRKTPQKGTLVLRRLDKGKKIIRYHTETNKTRCPPASPEGVADGGQAPGALHYVMGRGIDGEKIFNSKADRNDLLSRLADLCEKGENSHKAGTMLC